MDLLADSAMFLAFDYTQQVPARTYSLQPTRLHS